MKHLILLFSFFIFCNLAISQNSKDSSNSKRDSSIGTDSTNSGLDDPRIFTRAEIASRFPGGDSAWIVYLQNNLDPKIPVKYGAPAGAYQVIVKYIIGKDGSIRDVNAETNKGFGMEQEAVRIIKNSPRWIAAVQNGHNVNCYRRQPITFKVEIQK
jgi:protein TonB